MNPSNKPHPPTLVHGRTTTGINVPVQVDSNGVLQIGATLSGADGAILDGVSSTIRATVKNYTNSKPVAVINVDTNGDPTGGSAVTIANGADVAEGATTDAAVTGDNTGTLSAKARGFNKVLADVWDSANHWLKVSVSSSVLPTGAATETTLGGVLTTTDFDTKVGSLTETAPATDIASSGLNGRLQRVAQRITSLITALGSPFQAGGSIGNTSFASTVADGANVTLGAKADAKSTATDTTAITIMQVLKQISASVQLMVFGAGTAAAAQRTTLASDDPAVATLGATTGAKVITDANGTIQQYLRGLIYQLITAGASFVSIAASTTGGWTPYSYISAGSANQDSQVVKNSAGQIGYISVFVTIAGPRVLKLYDKATSPTSSDTPIYRAPLPNNTTGAGSNIPIPAGIVFSSGIAHRITSGVADSDTGAAAANDVCVNIGYK